MGTEERWQLERAGFEGGLAAAVSGFRCFPGMCSLDGFVPFPSHMVSCFGLFLCAGKGKNAKGGGLIASLVIVSPFDATVHFIPGFTTTSWV